MKKILSILALGAVASVGYSQGTVQVYSIAAGNAIYTNSALSVFAGGSGNGGTSGKTASAANGFYYTLLCQAYSPSITTNNPAATGWLQSGILATNYSGVAGGIKGNGGNAGAATTGSVWGAPTAGNYSDGTLNNFVLVGWSSNLGSTWATVSGELAAGWGNIAGYNSANTYFFGVSALGNGYAGAGPNSLPAPDVFGVTTGMPGGLAGGFSLYSVAPVVVPEPATLAMAALGGASLLLFRRRK